MLRTPLFLHFLFHCLPVLLCAQNRYDILITEFLADPSPAIGLPESEFIELTNHSSHAYQLHNYTISNGNNGATIKSDYILEAGHFLILCSPASVEMFSAFGPALGVSSFPSLNNESGEIILSTETGAVMHALQYDRTWFQNEVKAAGGWSLEMIDLSNHSTDKNNWTASLSPGGGTPGQQNSVNAENTDEQTPSLLRAVALDSLHLILILDESADSTSSSNTSYYSISDGIGQPDSALALPPFFDRIQIHLQRPLIRGRIYQVSVQQLTDCNGNEISLQNTCKTGMPEKITAGDVIFNEILFNPPPYGFDYLELYNRSQKIIRCSELFLAGRDPAGSLKDPVALLREERAFFPGEYLVLSENPDWLLHQYPVAPVSQVISLSTFPSLPDDLGKVVLLNEAGLPVDELDYDHHWHSPLLSNETGVALERIRSDLPTAQASNWTSAAAYTGYGTPGYKNSESSADSLAEDILFIEPKVFSPDMDGFRDFCFIHYRLPEAGYMGTISIYDISGRMVCTLVNNILWGTSGTFRWDGLDDQQHPLPSGHYVIYASLFLPDGSTRKLMKVCTLARR